MNSRSRRTSHHTPEKRPAGTTRRTFLGRVLGVGTAALGVTVAPAVGAVSLPGTRPEAAWAAGRGESDSVTREAFDHLDQSFNDGHGWKDETNDKDSSGLSGKLAWGEAYLLQGYALMYQTYGDTYYLDKMVDHIDHVLANRDSERGVRDYRDASQPAWRANHHYTVGTAVVPDTQGRPVLQVRTALAYADEAVATVSPGSRDGTFRLEVRHHFYGRTTRYDNLVLDPASDDYAVNRVLRGFRTESPDRVQVTLKDLRQRGSAQNNVAMGDYQMISPPYVFGVHTGQIALPLVMFARIVRSDPNLRAKSLYRKRADTYLTAAEEAVAVHDPEWRETERGEGYYVALPGAPVWWAGIDLPINQFLALGRATLQLAAVTGDARYVDRTRAMARTFHGDLTITEGGAYVWPYWWSKGRVYSGWDIDDPASEYRPWLPGNQSAEDVSHGQIDMNFALEMFRDIPVFAGTGKPVFTGADMERFAATFTQNVAVVTDDGSLTVNRFIDGRGPTGLEAYERQAGAWADLTPWDGSILTHLRDMFNSHEYAVFPSTAYDVARINHAAQSPA
ncbi:hypothetical protein [Phytoactinopolyspora endophytica]|uniref:hypothetical protein n=1 Tax=Phytoactinopolyspora endophytica TaxID=1642495 RepID=UPI0013EADA8B|nr:hypothetical protein [Phytoactinopolyspora endophytica]